jgi:hypothetical protein
MIINHKRLLNVVNVILAEHTVAIQALKNSHKHILNILHTKQNKSIVIESFHRKIDIVVQKIEKSLPYTIFSTQKLK